MKFINTRRELVYYMANNEQIGQPTIKSLRLFSASDILEIYKILYKSKLLFCRELYHDSCYENFWILGYKEARKQLIGDDDISTLNISAPANTMSRLCGELAMMHKDGILHRVERGYYMFKHPSIAPKDYPEYATVKMIKLHVNDNEYCKNCDNVKATWVADYDGPICDQCKNDFYEPCFKDRFRYDMGEERPGYVRGLMSQTKFGYVSNDIPYKVEEPKIKVGE